MNAQQRALNVWKRVKGGDGKVNLIAEMARALAAAHQQGIREGAVAMVDRAAKLDMNLSREARTHALVQCFRDVTGLKP